MRDVWSAVIGLGDIICPWYVSVFTVHVSGALKPLKPEGDHKNEMGYLYSGKGSIRLDVSRPASSVPVTCCRCGDLFLKIIFEFLFDYSLCCKASAKKSFREIHYLPR